MLIGFAPGTIYYYLLPVVFLFIGLILIWLSKTKILHKILWTIFPIISIPFFLFIWKQVNTKSPEVFLIPQNFKGKVSIIYNLKCAPEIKENDGKIIYQIPNDGILLISNNLNDGFINQKYFFVDDIGNKTEIPQMDNRDFNEEWTIEKNLNEPSRQKIGIFGWGTLGNYAESATTTNYYYQEFYVGNYTDGTVENFKESQRFDSIKIKKAKDCENKYVR